MFQFCSDEIPGIKFVLVEEDEIKAAQNKLEARFMEAKMITGTRQFHRFLPKQANQCLCTKQVDKQPAPQKFV